MAEDDSVFRRLLETQLHKWGYRVIAVQDGTDAWELLKEPDAPQLIILDWIMPGIDGLELCRRIREQSRERYQYVLLLTGKDDKDDVIKGLNAGADDYLTKPFDMGELRARVRGGRRILSLQQELIKTREELRFQATHDALTGLWNRGATLSLLSSELQRGVRSQTPTGILMIDLDHFKTINDTHGHLVGDAVLREASFRIGKTVRTYDFVGRYGGEEFLAILSNCDRVDLARLAERMRAAIADLPVPTAAANLAVTVSIGGAVATDRTPDLEVLSCADSALYEAKRGGRNRVVLSACGVAPTLSMADLTTRNSIRAVRGAELRNLP